MEENGELVERLADEVEEMRRTQRIDGTIALDRVLSKCGYRNREAPIRQSVMDALMQRSMGRIGRDDTPAETQRSAQSSHTPTSPPPPNSVPRLVLKGRISPRPRRDDEFDYGRRAAGEAAAARRELDQAS